MSGERDLRVLLATLSPQRRPGSYVFTAADPVPAGVRPVVTVQEDEGLTLVVAREDADAHLLPYEGDFAMVTLRVHSSLDAVGLTAAVAGRLAEADLGCNVVAGLHHDHLFVPADRADEVLALLDELTREAQQMH